MRTPDANLSALATQQASNALAVDPAGLHDLRRQAKAGDAEGLEAAARAFEALLVGQMMKQMRSASLGDGLFESEQSNLYREMHDQEIARMVSEQQGLGLREALMQQLGAQTGRTGTAADPRQLRVPERNPWLRPIGPAMPQDAADADRLAARTRKLAGAESIAAPPLGPGDWPPATPEDFLRVLKPQAEAAAAQLGFDPLVLLAQSALETGWGRRIPRHADGRSSYNLFGIKAHGGWTGDRVSVGTLEFRNGTARRERAQFRAYANPAESFVDYVDFLHRNPRYQQALASPDSRAFVRGLQRAGYATDPNYANKILSIHHQLSNMMAETPTQEIASATVTASKG